MISIRFKVSNKIATANSQQPTANSQQPSFLPIKKYYFAEIIAL
jgi:hypothetical protein